MATYGKAFYEAFAELEAADPVLKAAAERFLQMNCRVDMYLDLLHAIIASKGQAPARKVKHA